MSTLALLTRPAPAQRGVVATRRVQPRPHVDLSRMTRYRGGTYSHTVDTVVFTDGTMARIDLIRLNPNIDAYSLDFTGIAPTTPSRYAASTWAAVPHLGARAREAEVDWILRNSYPALSAGELSTRLRAAGYPLGGRNIAEHEAIAGTQAAIWFLTNGLELDTRAVNVPTRIGRDAHGLTVEFDGERQLAGYSATVSTSTGASLSLQKSADGQAWEDIAASSVAVGPGSATVSRFIGVGTTVSHNRSGRHWAGYRYYRIVVDGEATVADLAFRVYGSSPYRNAESVVLLYQYLLAGAEVARAAAVLPSVVVDDAELSGDGTVGPFRLIAASSAIVEALGGQVVGVDGSVLTGPVQPGEPFHLRIVSGASGCTVTVRIPGDADGFGGRVITGLASDEDGRRNTPLALAVPTQVVVEFDVEWSALAG